MRPRFEILSGRFAPPKKIASAVLAAGLAWACAHSGLVAGNGGSPNRNLEFRGYIDVAGDWSFSIHNKETGRGEWLREGETGEDFEIVSFNRDQFKVVVRHQGQTAALYLQGAQIKNYVPARPDNPPPTPPPGATRSVTPAPAGAERRPANTANAAPALPGANHTGSGRTGIGQGNSDTAGGFASLRGGRRSGGGSPGAGTPPGNGETTPPPSGGQPPPGDGDPGDDSDWENPGPPPGPPPTPVPSYDPDE